MSRGTQIGLGLLIAGVLIAALQWWVAVADRPSEPPPAAGGPDRPPPPDQAAAGRRVLEHLRGSARRFHLATQADQLPAGCAPVFRVRAGGYIQVPVAPPQALQPGPAIWPDVGVLLPQARVCDLSASERSSLLAIWSRLAGGQLTADRIRTPGCRFLPGELDLLLRWLR